MNALITAAVTAAFALLREARAAGATDEDIERIRLQTEQKVGNAVDAGNAALERGKDQQS